MDSENNKLILFPHEREIVSAKTERNFGSFVPGELMPEMRPVLRMTARDVGLRVEDREWPYIVTRISELLIRYYPNLTIKDFRMAFEMCVAGLLDDYLPKGRDGMPDRNHYQLFNADYVCKVLNAYRFCRAEALRKAEQAKPKEEEPPIDENLKREYHNAIRKELIAVYEQYRTTHILNASPIGEMLYYNILSELGFAESIEITISDQTRIWQHTLNYYSKRGMMGDVQRLKANGTDDPELAHGAFTFARRRALTEAFDRMIEKGIDLKDYITFDDGN